MAPVDNKTKEKAKMIMDSMVESSWQSKEYSALAEESGG